MAFQKALKVDSATDGLQWDDPFSCAKIKKERLTANGSLCCQHLKFESFTLSLLLLLTGEEVTNDFL